MSHSNHNPVSSLEDRIDLACDQFQRNWKSGNPIKIEDLLQEFEGNDYESALRELLAVELELRFRRGDMLRKEDYLSRLPGYDTVIAELLASTLHEFTSSSPPIRSSGEVAAVKETTKPLTLCRTESESTASSKRWIAVAKLPSFARFIPSLAGMS